jgi:probable rRNA maturation factor
MGNIKVMLFVESRYKVSRKRIVASVTSVLSEQSISGPIEVSVAIVGDRKMRALNKKYRNLDKTTNVLSFPIGEGEVPILPGKISRLGDVIVSYPEVIREAARDEMYVDDRIDELVKHGTMHLLGLHHE